MELAASLQVPVHAARDTNAQALPAVCPLPQYVNVVGAPVYVNVPSAFSVRPATVPPPWTWAPKTLESLRSEEHTSELQSRLHLVCRLLLEKKKQRHHRQQWRLPGSSALANQSTTPNCLSELLVPSRHPPSRESSRTTLMIPRGRTSWSEAL